MKVYEVNFDGLVGPTHNYAGLSYGNMASLSHAMQVSNPKAAALEGLAKMELMLNLGQKQAVLPPQLRPDFNFLRQIGFYGSDSDILKKAYNTEPDLLRIIYSASSMWSANAATVSPSADTMDNKVHLTVANLCSNAHRYLEANSTYNTFKKIFANEKYFTIHKSLPNTLIFTDEGAANHNRLCHNYNDKGIEIFVYNKSQVDKNNLLPSTAPARQSLEASKAIARLHGLDKNKTFFIRQNPDVVDKGVFHNDVISVANKNVFFYHELAFNCQNKFLDNLKQKAKDINLHFIAVDNDDISVEMAVQSYLFNSQLISINEENMALIAPLECRDNKTVNDYLQHLILADNPINRIDFVNCRQSMQNGGGPACLRLRVVLTEEELQAINPGVLLDLEKLAILRTWVNKHYRDELKPDDLLDPNLAIESTQAIEELNTILQL